MAHRVRITILILTLLMGVIPYYSAAQENFEESQVFQIGAILGRESFFDQNIYDTFAESGMDLICQYADNNTRPYLDSLSLMAKNDSSQDWVLFYGTGLYSKWE